MTVGSMSTFNPSISDSPQDQMYSVLHVFYRLVLKTLNESRKLWVKNFLLEKRKLREFPGGLVVRTQHSDSQGWVWSLVRELKSHKLDRVAKKKKKLSRKERGETVLCFMLKNSAPLNASVKFSHFVIYPGWLNRYQFRVRPLYLCVSV